VLGPKGLQLVKVTEVSLLVEWQPVPGAEYYVLSHYPKDDEKAAQEVRALQDGRVYGTVQQIPLN